MKNKDEEIDELLESVGGRSKCTSCGYLIYTNKEIAKRVIDEFSATTPQKFTIEEQIALQYCYKWLNKEE